MRKSKLQRAVTTALESSTISRELIKITQDDYDDGIQTLGLHYSDGSVELVKREWPDAKYRNGDNADALHELLMSSVLVDNPPALWDVIAKLSRDVS